MKCAQESFMLKKSKPVEIFIDGASLGNPGQAGIGIVIYQEDKPCLKIKKYIGSATNNYAEYSALIHALKESRKLHFTNLKIRTDSELVYRQLIGRYKVKDQNLKELYLQVKALVKNFEVVEISHIPREKNTEADKLAKFAAKEAQGDDPDTFKLIGEESPSS